MAGKQRKPAPKSQRQKRQEMTAPHAGETLWRAAFISALSVHGNVTVAADQTGITRQWAYNVRNSDEAFKAEWDAALEEASDRIEYAAYTRAVDGLEKGIYYKGDKVDTEREYSDTLMAMMLKGTKPEKYRERIDVKYDLQSFFADLKAAGINPEEFLKTAHERAKNQLNKGEQP
jgi:hypothetical protein